MKLSRDAWTLIIVMIVFGALSYWLASSQAHNTDSPSSYSTSYRGTKAFYLLLQELDFKVGRQKRSFDHIPDNARVLIMIDPAFISQNDELTLKQWVKKGNTLIISLSDPIKSTGVLGINVERYYSSSTVMMRPRPGKYSSGVSRVTARDMGTAIKPVKGMSVILKDAGQIIAAEYPLGNGRVIFAGDPMIFSNSNIKKEDNVVLATNLIYENVGRNDRVLFSEYASDPTNDDTPPVLGIGGKLALLELSIVALLVMISSAKRFGQIHPLKESIEKRKGWELVRAVAGLYHRAEAREHALTTIYGSFRRDLVMKFGVSPYATPKDVVETVARFAQVDKSKLESTIKRCERVAGGYTVSDGEVISLMGSIEELRRELGIARSARSKQ